MKSVVFGHYYVQYISHSIDLVLHGSGPSMTGAPLALSRRTGSVLSETAGSSDDLRCRHSVLSSEGYRDVKLKSTQRGQVEIACMVVGCLVVTVRPSDDTVCQVRWCCRKKPR